MKLKRCQHPRCRNSVRPNEHSSLCGKHRSRLFKDRHPLKYAFNKLKHRAKERGHAFTLTFAQYERFAVQTGYAELKGKHKYSLSIDRRDPQRGYEPDNIRAVSLSMNSRLAYANMPAYLREEMEAQLAREAVTFVQPGSAQSRELFAQLQEAIA